MRTTNMLFKPAQVSSDPYSLALAIAYSGAQVWCDGHIVEAEVSDELLQDIVEMFNQNSCGMKFINPYLREGIRRPSRSSRNLVSYRSAFG